MSKSPTKAQVDEPKLPAKVESVKSVSVSPDADFESMAGMGLENVTAKDFLIPRFTILQGLSPQMDRSRPEYIPGAELGDICDAALGRLYKSGLHFLPVFYKRDYIEWAPRKSGKGLVKIWPDEGILKECRRGDGKDEMKYFHGENLIAETAQFYGFILNAEGGPAHGYIPMTSTNLKIARKWVNLSTSEKVQKGDGSSFTPPIFFRSYKITSVGTQNNEGKWYAWNIARDLKLSELPSEQFGNWKDFIEMAVKFREAIVAGQLRADLSTEQPSETDSDGAM